MNKPAFSQDASLSLPALERIHRVCVEFEKAWVSGQPPRIETYLDQVDAAERTELLYELLLLELDYRSRQGPMPSVDEYLSRFVLDAAVIETAFAQGLSSTDRGRTPVSLQIRCPDCGSPFETDADASLANVTCSACGNQFSLVGEGTAISTVGHFELIERLGIGRFGVVWKARDTKLDRTVAVKIPRSGQTDPAEAEQFMREARTAAQLRHPNIVSVHEVGRDRDRVYIVSDLVDGLSLADWLTGQRMTVREAAELCEKIARALHYAHEMGIVHRDMKPANIMIDVAGEPHVMDFGLAKREVGEVTMTLDGQLLGTPAYMSPEQAQGEAHEADCRSDVYSLGVILFELLTGEGPFRGNARMLIHQVVNDEPPSPRKLNSTVPRDLETITLKCLEKDPARRYATSQGLAAELKHFLRGEPIHARPIRHSERLWRWCKRKPAVASLAAATATLLLAVAVVATVGYVQTSRALDQAEHNLLMVRKPVDDYLVLLSEDPRLQTHGLDKLRRSLLLKARDFYQQFVDQNPKHPQLRGALGAAYRRLAQVSQYLDELPDAEAACKSSVEIFKQLAFEHPRETNYQYELAMSYDFLGHLRRSDGWPNPFSKTGEAEEPFLKARDILQRLVESDPQSRKFQLALAGNYGSFGLFFEDVDSLAKAESMHRQDLAIRERFAGPSSDAPFRHKLARCHYKLGLVLYKQNHTDEAGDHYWAAIDIWRELLRADPAAVGYHNVEADARFWQAHSHSSLGLLAEFTGRPAEAIDPFLSAIQVFGELADKRPDVPEYERSLANAHHNLGIACVRAGNRDQAEGVFQAASDIAARLFSKYGTTLFQIEQAAHEGYLGNLTRQQRKFESALTHYNKSIALVEQALTAEPRNVVAERIKVVSYHRRAEILDALGHHHEAAADWQRASGSNLDAAGRYRRLRAALALARFGDHQQATQLAAELTEASDPQHLYDVARVYALAAVAQGQSPEVTETSTRQAAPPSVEQALLALRQAIASGYRAERHLDGDPDLLILHEQPAYEELRESIALLPADLIPADSLWKVLDDGSDPGRNWSAVDFEDAAWPAGVQRPRGLVPQEPALRELRPIPEILYAAAFFRTSFDVPSSAKIEILVAAIHYRGGCAIYLNGNEVHRDQNLRPEAGFSVEASASGLSDGTGRYSYISLPPDQLCDGENVLAVEVHKVDVSSSEINFHLTLSSDVVAKLVPILAEEKSLVRADAAAILDQLGPAAQAALPALRAVLDNENPDLRDAAREAIAGIEPHDQ